MYRSPQTMNQHVRNDVDLEQQIQAYDQGYEAHRQAKPYVNPWKRSPSNYDGVVISKSTYVSWEDDLNMWFYNGYYDWTPDDWVPWLADEQQSQYAINPKTGKSRESKLKSSKPLKGYATTTLDLNPIVAA